MYNQSALSHTISGSSWNKGTRNRDTVKHDCESGLNNNCALGHNTKNPKEKIRILRLANR